MKRATVAGVVAGILALSAPGIAADRTDGFPDGGKLVYGEYGRPATLDPITTNDMVGLRLTELLFNGLVSFSPKNEVVPDLAAKWSVSPDNRVYTFTLRSDVKWQAKAGVADVRKLDGQTLEITLKRPIVNALGRLAFKVVPTFALKAPDFLSRDDPFVQSPVGSGPFQLRQVTDEGDVVLDANPSYYKGRPHLDRVVLKPFADKNVLTQALL